MSEKRVLLDAAAFLDSEHAVAIRDARTADIREVVQRFLVACYQDLGKAPRLVDGEEMAHLLRDCLPRHFGVRDPLADIAQSVIEAYLAFLRDTQVVPAAYEQGRALEESSEDFRAAVASGAAHAGGVAVTGKGRTIVHRAEKVGRNDPCPCGSGKKFKKCCMGLGDAG